MMRKKIILLMILLVPWFASLAAGAHSSAQTVAFSQTILPLDCVLTVIDAGTSEMQYFTPQQCSTVIDSAPDLIAPAASRPTAPTGLPTATRPAAEPATDGLRAELSIPQKL